MKYFFTTLIIILFSIKIANSQEANGVIKTNPLGLLYSANLTYEKPLNETSSVILRVRYYHQRLNFTVNEEETNAITKGSMDFKFGYRYYLSKSHEAPNGFYISPTATLYLRAEEKDSYFAYRPKKTIINAGAHAGRQWLWGKFAFDIYGGFDIHFDDDTAFMPVGGLSIGFAH